MKRDILSRKFEVHSQPEDWVPGIVKSRQSRPLGWDFRTGFCNLESKQPNPPEVGSKRTKERNKETHRNTIKIIIFCNSWYQSKDPEIGETLLFVVPLFKNLSRYFFFFSGHLSTRL